MNRDEHRGIVFIDQFYHLLRLAVHGGGNQSTELRDAVVGVHHIVAHLQLVNLFQGDDGFPTAGVLARECHAVETLEYLMVGVAANLQPVIHKPLMQYAFHGDKGDW